MAIIGHRIMRITLILVALLPLGANAADTDDTRFLDTTVRFIGQRVAVVVSETVAAAERGAALVDVSYELLPAVVGIPSMVTGRMSPKSLRSC